jgi:hypothetical protein
MNRVQLIRDMVVDSLANYLKKEKPNFALRVIFTERALKVKSYDLDDNGNLAIPVQREAYISAIRMMAGELLSVLAGGRSYDAQAGTRLGDVNRVVGLLISLPNMRAFEQEIIRIKNNLHYNQFSRGAIGSDLYDQLQELTDSIVQIINLDPLPMSKATAEREAKLVLERRLGEAHEHAELIVRERDSLEARMGRLRAEMESLPMAEQISTLREDYENLKAENKALQQNHAATTHDMATHEHRYSDLLDRYNKLDIQVQAYAEAYSILLQKWQSQKSTLQHNGETMQRLAAEIRHYQEVLKELHAAYQVKRTGLRALSEEQRSSISTQQQFMEMLDKMQLSLTAESQKVAALTAQLHSRDSELLDLAKAYLHLVDAIQDLIVSRGKETERYNIRRRVERADDPAAKQLAVLEVLNPEFLPVLQAARIFVSRASTEAATASETTGEADQIPYFAKIYELEQLLQQSEASRRKILAQASSPTTNAAEAAPVAVEVESPISPLSSSAESINGELSDNTIAAFDYLSRALTACLHKRNRGPMDNPMQVAEELHLSVSVLVEHLHHLYGFLSLRCPDILNEYMVTVPSFAQLQAAQPVPPHSPVVVTAGSGGAAGGAAVLFQSTEQGSAESRQKAELSRP